MIVAEKLTLKKISKTNNQNYLKNGNEHSMYLTKIAPSIFWLTISVLPTPLDDHWCQSSKGVGNSHTWFFYLGYSFWMFNSLSLRMSDFESTERNSKAFLQLKSDMTFLIFWTSALL